jgi:hypothetical protein
MALLEADSHAVRLEMADKEQSSKATKAKYERYLHAYETWWDANQAQIVRSDSSRVAIPALPITVAKVAMFLNYESNRERKVCAVDRLSAPFVFDSPLIYRSGNETRRMPMQARPWDPPRSRVLFRPLNIIASITNTSTHISVRPRLPCVPTAGSRSLRRPLSIMSQTARTKPTYLKQRAALPVGYPCSFVVHADA